MGGHAEGGPRESRGVSRASRHPGPRDARRDTAAVSPGRQGRHQHHQGETQGDARPGRETQPPDEGRLAGGDHALQQHQRHRGGGQPQERRQDRPLQQAAGLRRQSHRAVRAPPTRAAPSSWVAIALRGMKPRASPAAETCIPPGTPRPCRGSCRPPRRSRRRSASPRPAPWPQARAEVPGTRATRRRGGPCDARRPWTACHRSAAGGSSRRSL